ncbi:HAD-like hydrolase superfamily protein [Abortiporus biennis]
MAVKNDGKIVLAFDIYGTLLDTGSITKSLIEKLPELDENKANQLSQLWRRYQLEYTWRLNSMELYESFDVITKRSLFHAAAELKVPVDELTAGKILEDYNRLSPFEDAHPTLQALSKNDNVKCVIFSNGTREMVLSAINASPLSQVISDIYVADSIRRYKPSPVLYNGLVQYLSTTAEDAAISYAPKDVWLVSGNPFDVTGARAAGLQAIWVDRLETGWLDEISAELKPTKIVHNLGQITEFVAEGM